MKTSSLKNVRKIHTFNVCGKTLLQIQRLKERGRDFPCELSEDLQSNLDLIKSLSKSNVSAKLSQKNVKELYSSLSSNFGNFSVSNIFRMD